MSGSSRRPRGLVMNHRTIVVGSGRIVVHSPIIPRRFVAGCRRVVVYPGRLSAATFVNSGLCAGPSL